MCRCYSHSLAHWVCCSVAAEFKLAACEETQRPQSNGVRSGAVEQLGLCVTNLMPVDTPWVGYQ